MSILVVWRRDRIGAKVYCVVLSRWKHRRKEKSWKLLEELPCKYIHTYSVQMTVLDTVNM